MGTPNQTFIRPGVPGGVAPSGRSIDAMAVDALDEESSAFVPSLPTPAAPPPPAPVEPAPKAAPVSKDDSSPQVQTTPAEQWQQALKNANITEEQAYEIVDAIIHKGYWEKEYSLWNGRVKVVFRTRDAQHVFRVQAALEKLVDRTQFSVGQTIFRTNIAGSLAKYQSQALPHPEVKATGNEVEDSFRVRYEFVGKLPGPVFDQMCIAMGNFDAIVTAAASNGAAQGF